MINVLLADDDIEMLQGLANIIRWEDYGFAIAGSASNGYEALNLVTELKPDVLVTDITMPVMNGLDLIREAKKFVPNIKSILITCHEDFSFAQEAIRLEADEYLTKHTLTGDELACVISNLRQKISSEREQRDKWLKADRELHINKHVIREKFFLDIMDNNIPSREDLDGRAALSGIYLPAGGFRLITFFADNIDDLLRKGPIKEYEIFKFSLLNIIGDLTGDMPEAGCFSCARNAFALLCRDDTGEPVQQRTVSLVKKIQDGIQKALGFKPSACFSGVYKDILELGKAFAQTVALRESYFFRGTGEIILTGKEYRSSDTADLYKEFGTGLKGMLNSHNQNGAADCIGRLVARIMEEEHSPASIKSLFRRLLIDIEIAFEKYGMNFESFQLRGDTFDDYRKTLEDALEYAFKMLGGAGSNTSREEIIKVVRYIETHLGEEITCENMAGYINMNSNYFSRLFKNEIGMTFSDYLINKRMEVATDLLKNTGYSIEEITAAIGIESISYFYRMYKRITGKTPGDVRNRAR